MCPWSAIRSTEAGTRTTCVPSPSLPTALAQPSYGSSSGKQKELWPRP